MKEQSIQISQESYAEEKLRELAVEDLIADRKFIAPEHKRGKAAKQIIGSLLWLSQARLGLCFAISQLSSTMVPALQDVDLYLKWIIAANKIIRRGKDAHQYINFRSPF